MVSFSIRSRNSSLPLDESSFLITPSGSYRGRVSYGRRPRIFSPKIPKSTLISPGSVTLRLNSCSPLKTTSRSMSECGQVSSCAQDPATPMAITSFIAFSFATSVSRTSLQGDGNLLVSKASTSIGLAGSIPSRLLTAFSVADAGRPAAKPGGHGIKTECCEGGTRRPSVLSSPGGQTSRPLVRVLRT